MAGVTRTALPSGGFAPLETQTLSWRIAARVRAALFSGEVGSGDFLGTEASIAERFGVSRMAARDALRSLAAMGIATIRPGKNGGAWVSAGDPARFGDALAIQLKLIGITEAEMLDAQAAIEILSAELAARRADDQDLARLRGIVRDLEGLVDSPQAFTARAMDFHAAVVAASHNRALVAQFQGLRHVLEPAYSLHTRLEVARRAIAAHRRLLARIVAGDAEGARRSMARRLATVRARGFADTLDPDSARAMPPRNARTASARNRRSSHDH